MTWEIINADCLDALRTMKDGSVDAVVTDPPYGLAFMGKKWDYDVPEIAVWEQCLRVLKPGGHLLCFAGTRTHHRMTVRIEDAGFDIRDMIAWVYGSGFPKSQDVGKAIDRRGGAIANFEQFRDAVRDAMSRNGISRSKLQAALGNHMLGHYLTNGTQPAVPNYRDYKIIRDTVGLGATCDHLFADQVEREIVGAVLRHDLSKATLGFAGKAHSPDYDGSRWLVPVTAPATEAAKQWDGWGTALRPCFEPITVARKPFAGTVASNVLLHGTGAVNVDGCRLPLDNERPPGYTKGRYPGNLIHDGSDEATAPFGKAARFFYSGKATLADRGEGNDHPTVKPTALMRYLCRLITPPKGVVLDPFAGSGSTGRGAVLEGFSFVGIELDSRYCDISKRRIEEAACERAQSVDLFDSA